MDGHAGQRRLRRLLRLPLGAGGRRAPLRGGHAALPGRGGLHRLARAAAGGGPGAHPCARAGDRGPTGGVAGGARRGDGGERAGAGAALGDLRLPLRRLGAGVRGAPPRGGAVRAARGGDPALAAPVQHGPGGGGGDGRAGAARRMVTSARREAADEVAALVEAVRAEYAPDPRLAVFEVTVEVRGGDALALLGATSEQEAALALSARIAQLTGWRTVQDEVQRLPEGDPDELVHA